MANYTLTIEVSADNPTEFNQMVSYFNSHSGQFSIRNDDEGQLKTTVTTSGIFTQWG